MTPEQFTEILGLTESEGRIEAWGDDTKGTKPPLAMGRFQIHPAWLWDYTRKQDAKPAELDSWDTWVEKLVRAFFIKFGEALSPVQIAMWFHLGHPSHPTMSDWDKLYAQRFDYYADKILP